ncbi:MAG: hypothetical protein ACRCX2_01190 [Paraclostridium sp.]
MTIITSKEDICYSFVYGEISKRLWGSYYSIYKSMPDQQPLGFSLKSSMNFCCDASSIAYKRPGTIRVGIENSNRCTYIIGNTEGESLIVSSGFKPIIYNHKINYRFELNDVVSFKANSVPDIFHNSKTEFWFLADSVYKIGRFGVKEYQMSKIVDVDSIIKPSSVALTPQNSMVLDNNKINISLNLAQPSSLSFSSNQLYGNVTLSLNSGSPTSGVTSQIFSRNYGSFKFNGTITFTGDYLDGNSGILYSGATVEITNPIFNYIDVSNGNFINFTGYDIDPNSQNIGYDHYRLVNLTSMSSNFTNPLTATMLLENGQDTSIKIVSKTTESTYISNIKRAKFYVGRLILFIGSTLYFSEPGDYSNFGTNNQNALKIPGVDNIIALSTLHGRLLFSDGKNLYSIYYQYNQGAPLSTMWSIHNLGQFNVIYDGIISIESSIMIVTKSGCYMITEASFEVDKAIHTTCITQHCIHLFDIGVARVLESDRINVFYVLRYDNTIIRFEFKDGILAGTVLYFSRTSALTKNYGCLNSVETSTKSTINGTFESSIDWYPSYNPDNNNTSRLSYSYLYMYNIHNWLDSASYKNSAYDMIFECTNPKTFKLNDIREFITDKLIENQRTDSIIRKTTRIMYILPDKNIEINEVSDFTNGVLVLKNDLNVKKGETINIIGGLISLREAFSSDEINRYKRDKNAYLYYCDGLRLNVMPLTDESIDYAIGLSVGMGFKYDSYIDLLLGNTFKPHAKLSAFVYSIDTTDYEIEYISPYENRKTENYNNLLFPNLYRAEFPSLDYWMGVYPTLRIISPTGIYAAFNSIYVNISV